MATGQVTSEITSQERKQLGAYYTPTELSDILADWAIQRPTENILEPSFGGCGFLASAQKRLHELGCKAPFSRLYGCDIHEGAFVFLKATIASPIDRDKFLLNDFLELQPGGHWPLLFDSVIGNPPYIPYQSISETQRHELANRAQSIGVPVGKQASLWAHFIIHSVSFVAPHGRMAWVLPGAFLQADYAKAVRRYLADSFNDILCILLKQRFFKSEGTEEETVLLFAKDRQDTTSPKEIQFKYATSCEELSTCIDEWEQGTDQGQALTARPSYMVADETCLREYERLLAHGDCHQLGEFLYTRIGLVTGANDFFVLSNERVNELGLAPGNTTPIFAKFKAAKGVSYNFQDHIEFLAEGGRGHLVHTVAAPREGSALNEYLATFTEKKRANVRTFKKRNIWHAPEDGNIPDAFFPVMHHDGPRIVLNDAQINCTNTIHRAFFHNEVNQAKKKLIAISLLTSFSQLSAEFVGRRYGSGVLKHEPRDAENIAVFVPQGRWATSIDRCFEEIDVSLREERTEDAHRLADKYILYRLTHGRELSELFLRTLAQVRMLRRAPR